MRASSELRYKQPKEDHSYHIKETLQIKRSKSKSYMDVIQDRAKVCSADSRKYSKIKDWTKNPGMKIPKEVKRSFFADLQK